MTGDDRRSGRRGAWTTGAVVGLLAAGAAWTGCAPAPADESAAAPVGGGNGGTETMVLEVGHETRWRELRIEGATDLPDGAVITYQVTHALANEQPRSDWPAPNLVTDGTAVVRDGVYWARVNTTYWPAGRVDVLAQFPAAPQPEAVRRRYGPFGEHLTGDNVESFGDSRVVTVRHAFDWAP